MPIVSIIIPIYNSEKWLPRCIDSVLMQTVEDWELILVDDGSTDNSVSICQKYADSDNRIKLICKPNGGVSTARNQGLKLAQGKYVSFIDSDDYVLPGYLEDMLEVSADIIVSGYLNEYEGSEEKRFRPIEEGYYSHKKNNLEAGLAKIEMAGCWQGPAAKLYLRNIISSNGIEFNEKIDYGEDHIFNMLVGDCIKSVSIINKHNYIYYHRKGVSLTNRMVPVDTMLSYINMLYEPRLKLCASVDNKRYNLFIREDYLNHFWQSIWTYLRINATSAETRMKLKAFVNSKPGETYFFSPVIITSKLQSDTANFQVLTNESCLWSIGEVC